MSLVDWERAASDPIRRQFLPLGSTAEPDHPNLTLDSLGEQRDAAVPGLTHRYPDKALLLALDTCPVYCRFCTRSYAVGLDTSSVDKVALRPNPKRYEQAFEYVRNHPELEDLVISGGDVANLGARWIRELGLRLLEIPHVRRIRYATKSIAILPQKMITDEAWVDALTEVADRGRELGKQVAVHTHFNTAHEITEHSQRAMARLFERGIIVRNQSVLQRGVNDTEEDLVLLVRRLSWINVQPYYVYMHDLVAGVEELRTTLATGIRLEKAVRGVTAGFNTPTFVVDAPGGGGKRDIHSFEHYDPQTGISVYTAPSVKPGERFIYVDPLTQLPPEGRTLWADEVSRRRILKAALAAGAA
jgi:lysine 2,3-aminomutase